MRMNHAAVATRLSTRQRDFLIAHVDGNRQAYLNERATRESCWALHLIGYSRDGGRFEPPAVPKSTHLTEDGRQVLCFILGMYADTLCKWAIVGADRLDVEASAINRRLTRRGYGFIHQTVEEIEDHAVAEKIPA